MEVSYAPFTPPRLQTCTPCECAEVSYAPFTPLRQQTCAPCECAEVSYAPFTPPRQQSGAWRNAADEFARADSAATATDHMGAAAVTSQTIGLRTRAPARTAR